MNRVLRRMAGVFTGIFCVLLLPAQTPVEELMALRNEYPDQNDVTTNQWRKLYISVKGDSLEVIQEEYEEVMILNNALQNSKGRIYTSSLSEATEVEAYTLVPGKKKYKRVDVEDFKRSYDKDSYVFFDDAEWINFNFPQIVEGAKVVKHYKRRIKDPHIIAQYFFGSYKPVMKSQFEIIADPGVVVSTGLFNEHLMKIDSDRSKLKNGQQHWSFSVENLVPIEFEDDSPGYSYLAASAYLTIASYMTETGEEKQVLASLDDLHAWYYGFIKDIMIDEEVLRMARQIVEERDSDLEKIRKIFYWVQNNVKYVAFEQGMRGFIPHSSGYVMSKRYGDCKDMSSLLVGLLRSVGVAANYTWIGSRNLPYSYLEIPSPIVDDHMIASVEVDGERIFLDATGSYTPVGFPTSMIQGKECLVDLDDGDYAVVKVPIVEKEKNEMIDTCFVKIQNGSLLGEGSTYLTGLAKVANTYRMTQMSQKKEDDYMRRLLSRGSNKFFLDSYKIANLEDLDSRIEVTHEFRIEDYYSEVGDKIYVNLCLDKSLSNELIKDRKVPLENDYKYLNRSVVRFEVPEGYEVSELPEESSGGFDVFEYHISYTMEEDQIVVTKEFNVDYLLMSVDQFDQWNTGIKQYSKAIRNAVVLTKK